MSKGATTSQPGVCDLQFKSQGAPAARAKGQTFFVKLQGIKFSARNQKNHKLSAQCEHSSVSAALQEDGKGTERQERRAAS